MVQVQYLNHVSPVFKWNYFTQKIFKEHNYLKSKTKMYGLNNALFKGSQCLQFSLNFCCFQALFPWVQMKEVLFSPDY